MTPEVSDYTLAEYVEVLSKVRLESDGMSLSRRRDTLRRMVFALAEAGLVRDIDSDVVDSGTACVSPRGDAVAIRGVSDWRSPGPWRAIATTGRDETYSDAEIAAYGWTKLAPVVEG